MKWDESEDESGQGGAGGGDEDSEPEKIQFEGVVQSAGGSQWIVDGRALLVDGETEIKGDPEVGDTVKVVAFRQADGSWWAEKIERED